MADPARLTITADMQDRAKSALKGLRGEVDANTEALKRAQKTSKDNADIESIFVRAKQRKLEALADENRKRVVSAREERAAATNTAGAFDKLKGGIDGVGRSGELLNKALGLGGFLGIAAGVVGVISTLIAQNSTYSRTLQEVQDGQERWNALLGDFTKRNRDAALAGLGPLERNVALTREQVELEQDKLSEARALLNANEAALNLTQGLRAQTEFIGAATRENVLSARSISELKDKEARLTNEIRRGTKAIEDHERNITTLLNSQTTAYERNKQLVEEMVRLAGKPQATLAEAVEMGTRAAREGVEKAKQEQERRQKAGASAGKAAADRLRGMDDEIAKMRFALRTEDEGERARFARRLQRQRIEESFEAKRLSAKERDRQLEKLDLEAQLQRTAETARQLKLEKEIAEQQGEADAKRDETRRKDRAETAAKAREASALEIEAKARGIDALGEAAARADKPLERLSGRLAGLGTTIRDTASIWSSYTRGQTQLGAAISSTIGVIGQQVAQAISDRRAQALVEGGFEAAAAIASYAAGDIPSGIGHTIASGSFFALAGQGKGNGASAGAGGPPPRSNVVQGNFGGGSSGGGGSRGSSQPTMVVHHYGQGIVFGLGADVARVQESTRERLLYTGHARGRF